MKEMTHRAEETSPARMGWPGWNDLFGRFLAPMGTLHGDTGWQPVVDVKETPEAYVITAEIPGVPPEDVHVQVTPDTISLSGEKRSEEKSSDDNWSRIERTYGSFHRSFSFPTMVDNDQVDARVNDGVLEVRVTKARDSKPRRVKIRKG